MNEILGLLTSPVVLRSELLASGHSDRDIARLVRAGVLQRIRRGAYVDNVVWDKADADERHVLLARAVVKQGKSRLVVSHASALPFYDAPTWGMSLDEVHVSRPDGRCGRKERGVRQHRGVLLEDDVVTRDGLDVTSATKTALDVTTCSSSEAGLVAMTYLIRHKATTMVDLRARYASMEHDPFTLKTGLVLRLVDDRLESVGEIRTFFMLYRGGVPAPVPQHEVRDENGKVVARLDFAWPELGVWLEFDGRTKYVDHVPEGDTVVDVVLREKQRESLITELTGWRCIRITWADLERPGATVARILATLGVTPTVPSFT
ncbi:MAG TPA: type IV toxin-antitoxin system AbiEi family antitoxin domain-containing protein [Nocardioides sp.]|jgi:hypothetical protein|nr:type IV toxin-antitoxin system AbiEi family antitoxin domain-containing protein [Nocardioides sp.]